MPEHEIRGSGPDLVMLHGWGMHAGIWSDWADRLSADFRVHLPDLPGHGDSGDAGGGLEGWSDALAARMPERAWWLGWSLGGLLALDIARRRPQQVRGLVMVAATPRFTTAPGWETAVDSGVFEQFATQLDRDAERTLVRFLSLQTRGAQDAAGTLRRLRDMLAAKPLPRRQALRDGLGILQHSDLRDSLRSLESPVHWLFGERDTLVPAGVARAVPGQHHILEGAGHAPFLSHPQDCADCIRQWLLPELRREYDAAF